MANTPPPPPTYTACGEKNANVDAKMGAISKLFLEVAEHELIDEPPLPREELIASFPGRSPQEVDEHCRALFRNYEAAALGNKCPAQLEVGDQYYRARTSFRNYGGATALGLFPSLQTHVNHGMLPFDSFAGEEPPPIIAADPSTRERIAALREGLPDRSSTNGLTWSKEEHELFLLGMECFGKGDWKNIAKYFVLSRTSTQIASHAQKFFTRRNKNNAGSRPSIHDIGIPNADHLTHEHPPIYNAQNVFYGGGGMGFFNTQFMVPATANLYQSFAQSQPAAQQQQFTGLDYSPAAGTVDLVGPNGDDHEFGELDGIIQDLDF